MKQKNSPSRSSGSRRKQRRESSGRVATHAGIKKLPEGRYWIRVRAKSPKTGKLLSREGTIEAGSLDEALEVRDAWRSELLDGTSNATRATLSDSARSWIAVSKDSGEARSTLENKVEILEHHILPYVGEIYVDRVERADLREWLRTVSSKTKPDGDRYSEATVLGWWRKLRTLVRFAIDEADLDFDPTERIRPRRYLHRGLRTEVQLDKGTNALTADELRRFLAVSERDWSQHHAMMVVGFFTGMRWSELSALRWEHFDLDTMEIRVRETQYRQTKRDRPKAKLRRGPAFDQRMWAVMQKHRQSLMRTQAPGFDSGLCFPSTTGGYRYPSVLDKPLKGICSTAGIKKRLSSKVFRRTYNDLCRRAGVSDIVLRAMIGHADRRMSELYASVDPTEKSEGLARVVALVGS